MPRIFEDVVNETEIKKSRFICYLHKCNDIAEAREFFKLIRKMHPDATHVCTAAVCSHNAASNDDGEPAGTAGRPMLDVLQRQNIEDAAAAVVRYFGGTLLGKGGLVRAYSGSVIEALNKAVLCESKEVFLYQVEFDYSLAGKIDQLIYSKGLSLADSGYDEKVTYVIESDYDITPDVLEATSGKAVPELIGSEIKDYPV